MESKCVEQTFTREEFYDLVWSAPATKLASELGCSDVMIGKVCKAFDIPKPFAGYWAKTVHGHQPPRTPLPSNSDPTAQTLTFFKHPELEATVNSPPRELSFDADILEMLETARKLGPVIVSETLRNLHPLVKLTKERMERSKAESRRPILERDYGWMDGPQGLSIAVSDEQSNRALKIFDAVIKRIESLGAKVEVGRRDDYRNDIGTFVVIAGERVTQIRLRERDKQVRHTDPTAKYDWDRHRTELVPTGLLLFDRGPSSWDKPFLTDTKSSKIEDRLAEMVVDFIRQVGNARIAKRERAEADRRRAEEARIQKEREAELEQRRAEFEQLQADEQARVDELVVHAESWRKSRLIRDYLDALCVGAGVDRNGVVLNSPLAEYLRWGFEQADRMDPLRPSPSSILDEEFDEGDCTELPQKPR